MGWLVKGLDLVSREERLTVIFKVQTRDGLFFELDFSRFDAHIRAYMLKVEHELYKWAFPDDTLLEALLKLQLVTVGFHVCGLFYTHIGKRCSGDTNTSIGNGCVNRTSLWWGLSEIEFEWASSHEGDDTLGVVFCRPEDHPRVEELLKAHVEDVKFWFGMPMEYVISPTVSGTTFCGRAHYMENDVIRSYCDIPRTAAKFHITTVESKSGYTHEELMRALLLAKCNSYLSTDGDTPMIGPLCRWLRTRLLNDYHTIELTSESDRKRRDLSSDRVHITQARREDVAIRYGIPIGAQLAFESQCKGPIRKLSMPICQVINPKEENFIVFPGALRD